MSGQPRCGAAGYVNNAGDPCGGVPIAGLDACRRHIGVPLERAKAKGQIRRAVLAWDLDRELRNPAEAFLRLMTVTVDRAEFLADLLQQAYDAAERIADAGREGLPDELVEAAARDLDEVLARGGVSALVGKTFATSKHEGVIATGEAIRGLAKLEHDERKAAADLAHKAIMADLEARAARIPETIADRLAGVLADVVSGLGFNAADPQVRRFLAEHLRAAAGGPAPAPLASGRTVDAGPVVERAVDAPAAGSAWRPGS